MIFDILLCMAEDVTESAFVEGDRSGTYGRGIRLETSRTTEQEAMLMRSARAQLWNKLRGLQLKGGERLEDMTVEDELSWTK